MNPIVEPTQAQLRSLVEPYLSIQPHGLAFAIGYASPNFQSLYFAGHAPNQLGNPLTLDENTRFELASISKTFTATLYAQLIRQDSSTSTLGDFIYPCGPIRISDSFASIALDNLANYTSGLPQDNGGWNHTAPFELPQPYYEAAMLSYLRAPKFPLGPQGQYTYSNLGFALLGSVLANYGRALHPQLFSFAELMKAIVFDSLGMNASFFDDAPLDTLIRGNGYDYGSSPPYSTVSSGWPAFPAYFGAGGIVASPRDMQTWLLFNMGLQQSSLSSLLPALQTPSTSATFGENQLGLGWFINPSNSGSNPASVWKDGELQGTQTYIAFLPSPSPGIEPSQAGVFVLVNASNIASDPSSGQEAAATIANDLLYIMQGIVPPTDKSAYPSTIRRAGARLGGQ